MLAGVTELCHVASVPVSGCSPMVSVSGGNCVGGERERWISVPSPDLPVLFGMKIAGV